MPQISKQIHIQRSPQDVFMFLTSFSKYPSFIQGVKSVSTSRLAGSASTSSWRILINDTPIEWKQLDEIDESRRHLKFKLIEGDFGSYDGKFEVNETPRGSLLKYNFNIEWNLSSAEDLVSKALEDKAKIASLWMLRKIRKALNEPNSQFIATHVPVPVKIVSQLVEYRNKFGNKIVAYFDRLEEGVKKPIIIIPPGYGETKRDALTTAYYLAYNGFNVLRYDATNHVGESDGTEIDTSMSSFHADLSRSIDYVAETYPNCKIGIVASSLAKRIALRIASHDKRVSLLVGIVGIVNLRETLKAVYQEDMIGSRLEGREWEVTDVLGLKVSGDFLNSAITDEYHSIETTLLDAQKLEIPVVFLAAEKDTWVNLNDVKIVYETLRQKNGEQQSEFHLLRNTPHAYFEQAKTAIDAIRLITTSCNKYLNDKLVPVAELIQPSMREIATQNTIEKNRLKSFLKSKSNGNELSFWDEYLSSYYILSKSPDYKAYLDDINRLLGPYINNEKILDAGCGNGNYGSYLLVDRANKLAKKDDVFAYYGIDFVERTLAETQANHRLIVNDLRRNGLGVEADLRYFLVDLAGNQDLPVQNIDKVCMSLVLSYLENPIPALERLKKSMKQSGRILISSLKPHCDLSMIYTNFIAMATSEREVVEARNLLSNAGIIKQKEAMGFYRFYGEQELKAILISVGFKNISTANSFGGQANIAVGTK